MNDEAERVLAEAARKVEKYVAELIGAGLVSAWAEASTDLYKEQFSMKENPYGQPWTPRPGDAKRTTSSLRFGSVVQQDAESFSLRVARSNANRSCVPYEPGDLGRWKAKFREILARRAEALAGSVR